MTTSAPISLTRALSLSLVEVQVDAVHRDEAYHVLNLLAPVKRSLFNFLLTASFILKVRQYHM